MTSSRHRFARCAALLFAAALALPAARAQDVPELKARVTDQTGTLSAEQLAALEARSAGVEQRKGAQLVVLVVSSTAPDAIEDYSLKVAERNRIGRKGTDDGVLLLVAKDDRKARVEVGYGLEGAIPDISASRVIREYLTPHFRKGDYYGGLDEATQALAKLIEGEPLPAPLDRGPRPRSIGSLQGALGIALVVAMLARVALRRWPRPPRAGAVALIAGGVVFGLMQVWFFGVVAALVGAFVGATDPTGGGWNSRGGFGGGGLGGWGGGLGGGSGGGWSGGGGGGGWSGGGGSFGGGGASGGW